MTIKSSSTNIFQIIRSLEKGERAEFVRLIFFPWVGVVSNVMMYLLIGVVWYSAFAVIEVVNTAVMKYTDRGWFRFVVMGVNTYMWVLMSLRHQISQYTQGIRARTRRAEREALERFKQELADYGDRVADSLSQTTGHTVANDPISLAAAAIEVGDNVEAGKNNPFKSILDGNLTQAEIDLHDMTDKDDEDEDKPF